MISPTAAAEKNRLIAAVLAFPEEDATRTCSISESAPAPMPATARERTRTRADSSKTHRTAAAALQAKQKKAARRNPSGVFSRRFSAKAEDPLPALNAAMAQPR